MKLLSIVRNRVTFGVTLSSVLMLYIAVPVLTRAQDSAESNYNKKCAVCHAKDGSGNTAKGKKLHVKSAAENMSHSEQEMIKMVTDGKGDEMDAYKGQFTPDQITALVGYYRSLGKK